MIQLELSYKTSTIGLVQYLDNTNDWMLQLVNLHENEKNYILLQKNLKNFLAN